MDDSTALLDRSLPTRGERLLLLAPPGELEDIALDVLHRVGEDGEATAVVRGDAFLQAKLPTRLRVVDAKLAQPALDGHFDAILAWGSTPWIRGTDETADAILPMLRPGGRFVFDLPCYGFSPVLQSCDPQGGDWVLPQGEDWRTSLEKRGFRDVRVRRRIVRASWATLAELLDARVRAFPLDFENREGVERQDKLRKALAEALGRDTEIELALRYASGHAIR